MDRLLTRKIRDQEKEIFMKLTAHYIISSFYFHIHQIKPTYPQPANCDRLDGVYFRISKIDYKIYE